MFNLFRNILIVSLFMTASGFVLSEMLLAFVLPLLSVRALVFALSALVCWLLLDSVTLSHDLAHATANTSTDGERHLLRSLLFASRRRALTHSQLEEEIASHRATALQLDLLSEQSNRARITALHWSLLASKSIVVSNLERMQNDRRQTRSSSWDCAFRSI